MSNKKEAASCCSPKRSAGGFWRGLLSGVIPHFFCILFIIFTLIGSVAGASMAKKFLLIPHFFLFLVILSLIFATISAWLYLRRKSCCSAKGIKGNWKYLLILYSTTLAINLIFIYFIFPAFASANNNNQTVAPKTMSSLTIKVDIPCSGHASLITSELKTINGVGNISYIPLSTFEISYDPSLTNPEAILSLEIFKTYPAKKL
jgi:hypothetical protein